MSSTIQVPLLESMAEFPVETAKRLASVAGQAKTDIEALQALTSAPLSNATPLADAAVGAAGVSTSASRDDHVHPAEDLSTTVGTVGGQSQLGTAINVVATTTNAAAVTVDTGYACTSGHASKADGGYSCTDRTAHKVNDGNVNVAMRNYSGMAIAGTPVVSGHSGDTELVTAVPSFTVVSGTLNVTFTPPGAYSGTIDWLLDINITEN